jgi:glutamate-1-semialdehyde 2,1-aminomutase/spore coat polysaccharide biosynthesis protein SpsF
MKKVVAIIQARMGSTRLPGKVMMDLGGHPVLEWCVRAARAAPGVDEVWVATTTQPADDVIAGWCQVNGISCWCGSEIDVLSRFIGCAAAALVYGDLRITNEPPFARPRPMHDGIILRLTGDCPFLDPEVIGGVVRLMQEADASFCSNVSPRTYPDGLDVQAMTAHALHSAHEEATRAIDRDCVCTWIERNRSRFPAATLINPIPNMEGERWVLDTENDLMFCKAIALKWPWDKGPPSMLDILGILDKQPAWRKINQHHPMNERYFDALAEEPVYERTFERSQAQFETARNFIPLAAQTFSKSHLQYPQPSPLFLSHGDGALVWDVDGNEFVDLVSALLPNILGYRDHDVDAAIRRQLSAGVSFSLATELEAELAETLCRLIPCAEMVRFGKTGTDATTAAVRLSRAFTGRDRILICGGYHGWADWSVERNLGVPAGVRNLTERCSFGNPADLYGRGDFAAVIVEPESDPQYLKFLREWCDKHGSVLIFDEVITGFRFDLGGAQKLWGVTPDLATFGKAMANGMPLSAIVGRRDIMKRMEPPDNIFYSGTFFGETLSLAAGIATIAKLERDNIPAKLHATGVVLAMDAKSRIADAQLEGYIWLDGDPTLKRLKFKDDKIAALFRREMVASGTLIVSSHNLCAAHGPSEIKRILKSYDHALGVIRDAIDKGDVEQRLAGASVAPTVRGGLRVPSLPSTGPIGDGVALTSMEHPPGLIDEIADAIRSGKLKMP